MGIEVVELLCEIEPRAVIDRIDAEQLLVAVEPVDQGVPVEIQVLGAGGDIHVVFQKRSENAGKGIPFSAGQDFGEYVKYHRGFIHVNLTLNIFKYKIVKEIHSCLLFFPHIDTIVADP